MNNIKLLKAQYKLNMSIIDKRGKVGIEKFVTALEEHIAELEAAQQSVQAEICPACHGDCERLWNDGLMHKCDVCKGTGKRPDLQSCGHPKDAIVGKGRTHWCAECEAARH